MKDQILFQGSRWTLVSREDHSRSGALRRREVVIHPGSVVILPFTAENQVVLIRNHRVSVNKTLLELPAGTLGVGEEPAVCAQRELIEETGFKAGKLELLTSFYLGPGVTNERMHAFAAFDLQPVGQKLEDDEQIVPAITAWNDCLAMVKDGEIEDAKTIAVMLFWAQFRR